MAGVFEGTVGALSALTSEITGDHPANRARAALERRAHHPLARVFVLIEEAEGDVVVHGGADVARGDLHIKRTAETLGSWRVAGCFLEESDFDRIADGFAGRWFMA